jgi:hypothetical protein
VRSVTVLDAQSHDRLRWIDFGPPDYGIQDVQKTHRFSFRWFVVAGPTATGAAEADGP